MIFTSLALSSNLSLILHNLCEFRNFLKNRGYEIKKWGNKRAFVDGCSLVFCIFRFQILSNMYLKSFIYFRSHYMQLIPLTIILQTCIASIAVLYLLMHQPKTGIMIQLAISVYAASFYNGAIIAQLPKKPFTICSLPASLLTWCSLL